jgi:hypothetical protein
MLVHAGSQRAFSGETLDFGSVDRCFAKMEDSCPTRGRDFLRATAGHMRTCHQTVRQFDL